MSRRRSFHLGLLIGVAIVIAWQTVQHRTPSVAAMPPAELNFLAVVLDARQAWIAAPNDLARVGMRDARATALCNAAPALTATNWNGIVRTIAPDGFPDYAGRKTAQIVIALAPHLSLATPAAPLLNLPGTMVEAGSPLYAAAATIRIGAGVVFSARLLASGADCADATNLTDAGAMTEPQFKMQLTALAAAK